MATAGRFEWRLTSTTPALQVTETPLTQTTGDIALGFPGWACRYAIEDPRPEAPGQQFGVVSCMLARTGTTAATTVLCMEDEHRASDCGAGNLRVSDGAGLHQLELTCGSRSSACEKRPGVTEPSAQPEPPTGSTPMGHFQWKVEVDNDDAKPLSSRRGDLAAELVGWQCSYAIAAQTAAGYSAVEIGNVTCKSKSSPDIVTTAVVCAENAARPSACNLGGLRLRSAAGEAHNLVMSCKSPSSDCW